MSKLIYMFLLFVSSVVSAQSKTIEVVLFGGQSNATGQGYIKNIPAGFQTDTSVRLFYSHWLKGKGNPESWIPLSQASESQDRFGAEMSMGTELHKLFHHREWAIIKHATSGTNLYSQWNPGADPSDTLHFGPEFKAFVTTVRTALQQLREMGYDPHICAMAWQQGEADARDVAGMKNSIDYGTNLRHFIDRVRAQFQCPEMVFVYGYVIPVPAVRFPGRDAVRRGQYEVSQYSGSKLATRRAVLIDTGDLPLRCDEPQSPYPNDKLHFNTLGIIELGKRYAGAIAKYHHSSP